MGFTEGTESPLIGGSDGAFAGQDGQDEVECGVSRFDAKDGIVCEGRTMRLGNKPDGDY